jgi:hypothetical protein
MKVKEMIEELKKLDPEALCIYSADDDGNGYSVVSYGPKQGLFEESSHGCGDFLDDKSLLGEDKKLWKKAKKAVCIN